MAALAAAARRVGAPVACLGQPPCAISHRMASAFVLRGVHIACLSRATRAGRALRGTLRGGLATEICPRHTRPVGTLIAPVDRLPRSKGPVGYVGRLRSDLAGQTMSDSDIVSGSMGAVSPYKKVDLHGGTPWDQ